MRKHRSDLRTLLKFNSVPTTRARRAKKRENTIVLEEWTEEGRPDNSADYGHHGKTPNFLLKMKLINRRTDNRRQRDTSRIREFHELASFTAVRVFCLFLSILLPTTTNLRASELYNLRVNTVFGTRHVTRSLQQVGLPVFTVMLIYPFRYRSLRPCCSLD